MRSVVFVLILLATSVAGCSTYSASTEEGYYASGAIYNDPKLQKRMSDLRRQQEQSASDFAQPRGIWW
jgi:hypothetical protein